MKKHILSPSMLNKLNKACVKADAKSPEIFVALGITGVVIGTIAACVASTKVSSVISETNKEREKVIETKEAAIETMNESGYTDVDEKSIEKVCGKELTKVYTRCGLKILNLYLPALCFEVTGIVAILSSYNILNKRNVAISASYTALNTIFKEYRQRVADRFGEEVEKEIRYDMHKETVEKTIINEKGEEETITEEVMIARGKGASDFARWFDAGSTEHVKDAFRNRSFLNQCENFANAKLRTEGYLFINDVYDMLGLPKLYPTGQLVGWIYDPDNPEHAGDNYVSFGMVNTNKRSDIPNNHDFINGYEYDVFLDFNVDGVIVDKIK